MQKILTVISFSTFLFFSFFCNVSGQTENILPGDKHGDEDEFYSTKFLESDFNEVDTVAYVDVKKIEIAGRLGDKTDCENNKGGGYCLYLLTAEVKQVFKGKIETKTLKFYTSPDADYPKNKLLGEKVVFLNRSDNYPDKKLSLGTLENSTRLIESGILEKLRKIAEKN